MTSPVVPQQTQSPVVTLEQEVLTNLHNKLHSIIFAHIGVVILLITALFGVGYVALKVHEHDLAHAEQLQAQFVTVSKQAADAQKQLADIIAQDAAARAQESTQQQQIVLAMAQRAQAPPAPTVQAALAPSATAEAVSAGLRFAYSDVSPGMSPVVESDGKIAVGLQDAQAEVSAKVNLDRAQVDLKSETSLYTLETFKSNSLNRDLTTCQSTVSQDEEALKKAQETIKAYEKVAKQSRFRKILGNIGRNAERIGILIAGIELGHKL